MALYVLLGVLIVGLSLAWFLEERRPRRSGADAGGGDRGAGSGWADSGGDCSDAGGDGGGCD